MNKDEILAKSRAENQNQDLYEKEVRIQAANLGGMVIFMMATLYVAVDLLLGDGPNMATYSLVMAFSGSNSWVKWARLRHRSELVYAVIYTVLTAIMVGLYIWKLVTKL